MVKVKVKEAIVVEGRYDKNTLAQVVDALIIETGGFAVFRDRERLAYLRRLAEARGLIIMTDGDGAGFVIRRYLKGAIDPSRVKHAYIPDIAGRERRKKTPSREGKLGVEGMDPDTMLSALAACGATFENETPREAVRVLTKADLYADGLLGGEGSRELRRRVLRELALPERLGSNAMIEALGALCDRAEYEAALDRARGGNFLK